MKIKEMNTFFQLEGEKEHLLQNSYLHVIYINLVYMEISSFAYCKNIISHIKTLVFQILWTIFRIFDKGVP